MTDPIYGGRLPPGSHQGGAMPYYGHATGRPTAAKVPDPDADAGSYVVGVVDDPNRRWKPTTYRGVCARCQGPILLDRRDPAWLIPVCPPCGRRILEDE